jgi:tetratricopeptide (TPR) repeat protein
MKCIEQAWRQYVLFWGLAFALFTPVTAHSDEISRQCTDTNLDLINTLRSCDVVIGRQNTPRAERIRAFQVRAKIHLASRNIDASINDLTSAISALPDGKLKGYVLFLRGQTRFDYSARTPQSVDASLVDLEQADNLSPDNPRIIELLARVYGHKGLHLNAINQATAVLKNDDRALTARKVRAAAYEASGNTREALIDLDILLERQRGNPDLLTWRGRIHERRRNLVQALADYRNAARLETTQELLDSIERTEKALGQK